jgi:molybdopterin adenylyltransferase
MAKVIAVCRSDTKGVRKEDIRQGTLIQDFGLETDAHADATHRQLSLLDMGSIQKMRDLGLAVNPGDFAENVTTEGIELYKLPVGTILNVGRDIVLQVTQIGKECHVGCAIFKQVGKCIMPKEGIFARIIRGGTIKAGDKITVSRPPKAREN